MRHLIDDDATRVIALFIEAVRRPGEFVALARETLARGKPVVALKVGRSQRGARVAKARTGSPVGDDAVADAVFRHNGVIRVDSLEDLIITAGLLAVTGPLPGACFGFITASGGASEIIADRAEDEGIEIPEFAPETVRRLRRVVPPFAAVQNPVDVTGYVLINRDLMRDALRAVQEDRGLDALAVVSDLPRAEPADPALVIDSYRQSSQALRAAAKPVIVMGNTLTDITAFGRDVASQTGYHGVLGGIHHGLTALGHGVRWPERHRAALRETAGSPVAEPVPVPAAADQLLPGRPGHRGQSTGRPASSPRTGYPSSPVSWRPVRRRRQPRPAGSATPSWSSSPPAASAPALLARPAGRSEILRSLRGLRGARLFAGARGTEKADLEAVADVISSAAALAQRLGGRLGALEINPLHVRGSRVEALDALITWRQP